MYYIASCSFGKDSLAMVLRLIEENRPLDEVVFYDTGMEFQSIYNVRDRLLQLLAENGIKYTELKPDRPFIYDMLYKPVESKQKGKHNGYGWCGGYAVGEQPQSKRHWMNMQNRKTQWYILELLSMRQAVWKRKPNRTNCIHSLIGK